MKIAIARPGTFTKQGKERPSTEVNWIYYDAITLELERRGYEVVTIGFTKSCGAARILQTVSPFDVSFVEAKFKTKTQQAITQSILSLGNNDLLQGVDLLLMPYYTHMGNRSTYFPLMYLAAERGIPVMLWDTDANFIGEVSLSCTGWDLQTAVMRVFANPTYVVDDCVNTDILNDVKLVVLTPAMNTPNYATYFPFFSIFDKPVVCNPETKEFDTVYAGSEYGRRDKVLKYYRSDDYTSAVVGKFGKDFPLRFGDSWNDTYQGHISQFDVPTFIRAGLVCVQIARGIYEKLGHITPRVFEVVYNGTLLLIDGDIQGADKVVGREFLVYCQDDVIRWLDKPYKEIVDACNQQAVQPYMQRTVMDAVDDLLEIADEIQNCS